MKGLTFVRWSKSQTPVFSRFRAGAALVGLAWALGITFAACILMFAWVVLSVGPVYNFSTFVIAGSISGAVAGGAVCGRAARSMGLAHGFLTGLSYGLLLAILFYIGSSATLSAAELSPRVLLLGVAGAFGGLLGVNSHVRKKTTFTARERPFV
ncbi:MAG: TIGR04086 family membrane protein [Peptococcaceae bacterium]|nr:TIGR04086 family membrane protein [Candidatus Syntrophopropionicum ammoniitolerans]